MANETQIEIAAKISAHTYTHAAWMQPWEKIALKIMAANMGRGQAGKASPVAAKALARIEANFLTK